MLFQKLEQISSYYSSINLEKISKQFNNLDKIIHTISTIQQHQYRKPQVCIAALLHRSALVRWPDDKTGVVSNECLEFLGDAYLNFFVATEAMIAHPQLQEGDLSKIRAALAGTENLAEKAMKLGLNNLLLIGHADMLSGKQACQNAMADAFEAITAALLLDAGEDVARQWLLTEFSDDLLFAPETLKQFDVKTQFQQWTQSIIGVPPTYRLIGTEGTPQELQFVVAAFIGNEEIQRASAVNKREASKIVALKMQQMVDRGELNADMIKQYHTQGNKK